MPLRSTCNTHLFLRFSLRLQEFFLVLLIGFPGTDHTERMLNETA